MTLQARSLLAPRLFLEQQDLPLRHAFRLATGTSRSRTTIVVGIEGSGALSGHGEAAPIRYRGETVESVRGDLLDVFATLVGIWPKVTEILRGNRVPGDPPGHPVLTHVESLLARAHPRAFTARCALSVALHDAVARRLGLTFRRLLGVADADHPLLTHLTIAIDEPTAMLERVAEAKSAGMDRLKIKCGEAGRLQHDLSVLVAIRERFDGPLAVDANGGWTLAEAVLAATALRELNLTLLEQPLPRGQTAAWSELKRRAPDLPLYADEDSQVPADLDGLGPAVDGINVKLMKCGGVSAALAMIRRARERGWGVMLGCMVQSSLGISAAAQLAGLVDHLDLDAPLLLAQDPWVGITFTGNRLVLGSERGHGAQRREPTPD